ncbi:MAG: metallophosphoesterase family protein, partial [Clostridia bacterium]|nr:metallophosphoesterase family protein [Clostridia bacterium]
KQIGAGNVLLSGHTHVPLCETVDGVLHLNPGSTSIPKEGSVKSYMTFDGVTFSWKNLETGETYMEK